MLIQAAQADVQKIVLAKTPAVAFDIRAKIQLGRLRANAAAGLLPLVHFKLSLLRNDGVLAHWFCAGELGHRAKVPAGADQQPRPNGFPASFIDDPCTVVAAQARELGGRDEARARSL